MFNYIWPIGLVVFSNIVYQICAKSVPQNMNPFASLTITYSVAAILCAIMFFVFNKGESLVHEYAKLNWSPFVLGFVIIGLEAGFMFAYRAGWQVSTASIVQSSFLTVALLFVGWLAYHEPMTWNKVVGIIICMIGLIFVNYK
ncbi:MAG: EamA family transporter [Ruminococcus sp.]|nr:EamA family transporter [Candidatus Copronaster equi]